MTRTRTIHRLRRGSATPLPGDDLALSAVPESVSVPWSIAVEVTANKLLEQMLRQFWLPALACDDFGFWWPSVCRVQASALLRDAVSRAVLILDMTVELEDSGAPLVSRLARLVQRLFRRRARPAPSPGRISRVEAEIIDILNQAGW